MMFPKTEEEQDRLKNARELEDRQGWVAGLRFNKSIKIVGEPIDRSGEEFEIFHFFQGLVGEDHQIESIEIFAPELGEDCNCGCSVDEDRLIRACTCVGGTGIITFKVKAGKQKLKSVLRTHSNLHEKGIVSRNEAGVVTKDTDGKIDLCETCCIFNKQITMTPVRPGVTTLEQGQYELPTAVIDQEKAVGLNNLILGIFGLRCQEFAEKVSGKCLNQTLEKAKNILFDEVSGYLKHPEITKKHPDRAKIVDKLEGRWVIILEEGGNTNAKIWDYIENVTRLEQGVSQTAKNKNSEDKDQNRSEEEKEEDRTLVKKRQKNQLQLQSLMMITMLSQLRKTWKDT